MSTRRSNYSTGAWLRDVARLAARDSFRAGGRSSSAAPGSISARWSKGFPKCRMFRRMSVSAGAAARRRRAPPSCTAARCADDPEAAARHQAERRPAHRARAGGAGSVRPFDQGMAGRARHGRSSIARRRASSSSSRRARCLRERIEARFSRMVGEGAIEEVRRCWRSRLDPSLPAMKAIGVRELGMAIEGRIPLDEAERLAAVCDRAICEAAIDLVPQPARPGMAAACQAYYA